MHTLKKRTTVAIITVAIVAPLALFLQYNAPPSASIESLKDTLPRAIGDWAFLYDREPTKEEIEILETEAILTRAFTRGGVDQVDLSITYAPENRRVAHPPELCYKGSGWSVEDKTQINVPTPSGPFPVIRLLLIRGANRLVLLYWFKAGANYTAGYWHMQWLIIKDQFLNRRGSSALLRAGCMFTESSDDSKVTEMLKGFVGEALPSITEAVR
ncbi:EpsI family protein [bacterium]|nr:EpsI family protein [bacterium]